MTNVCLTGFSGEILAHGGILLQNDTPKSLPASSQGKIFVSD
jgi:hypothetical protein